MTTTATDPGAWTRLRARLAEPVDPAGLDAFRRLFGAVAIFAALRFVARGWVHELLLDPPFHFAWVPGVAPVPALVWSAFAAQLAGGLALLLGRPRAGLPLWLLGFGYVELLDQALYLNHYVLWTLLGLWLLLAPAPGRPLPRGLLWLLRVQVGSVWVWAGLAKLNADWLLRAEPLATWLAARRDVPTLGPLLAWQGTAWAMSWAGAAYDLSIPFLLLAKRTRRVGLVLLLGFHTAVGLLFPIGIFPLLMLLAATWLLPPSWPRSLRARFGPPPAATRRDAPALSTPRALAWLAAVLAIVLLPARFLWWDRDVSWGERGHRFAWRVLLNEKTGFVEYRVIEAATGRTWVESPGRTLTPMQHDQMRTQPTLIRAFALHLRDQHAAQGRRVAVYADAWAALNGGPACRLLRDDLDLTAPLATLDARGWILPRCRRAGQTATAARR